ncbi:MAG: ROK family protein [Fermentimonas sp.]|jgi:glucokinase
METSIGLDLGGTAIKYALVNRQGEVLHQGTRPSSADISAEAVIHQLLECINDVRAFANSRQKVALKGIGIGTPGIIDETNRIVLGGAENITGWENIHLAQRIESETKLATILANDANAMGLGESMFGAGKNYQCLVFITVGTGIGGAVIIDGKLFNGYANRGTELGHVPFIANGIDCACGSVGCLEAYASTAALIRTFVAEQAAQGVETTEDAVTGKIIVEQYKKGDPLAVKCLNQHCDYLGHGIAGFINVFSPQRVVIGGGLPEAGNFYIEMVRKAAFRYAMGDCAKNTEIVPAQLGNMAGTIGAASLTFTYHGN